MNSYIEACFVTGAGKGIGRAVVDLALQKKQFIIALVKNKRDLKSDKKKKLKVFYGDVTKPKDIDKIFTYCLKNQIYIKYLINNAGQRQRKPFLKINKSDLLKIFQVNFFSVFFIIQKYILYLNKIKKKRICCKCRIYCGSTRFQLFDWLWFHKICDKWFNKIFNSRIY